MNIFRINIYTIINSFFIYVILLASNSKANVTVHNGFEFLPQRSARVNLLSFNAFKKDIALGLDYLLPFLEMPVKRSLDKYGNEPPLLRINTAAILSTGVVTGIGIFVGHLLRSLSYSKTTFEPKEEEEGSEGGEGGEGRNERRADIFADDNKLLNMLNAFKLVYTNTTGARVETTASSLFSTIDEAFLENDINLVTCIQKSICSLVFRASTDVLAGHATNMQKIIDGITNVKWLIKFLRQSAISEAIGNGKKSVNNYNNCDVKYPECKWAVPEEQLFQLINTYIQFV